MNITTSGDRDAMSAAEREISGRSTHENAEVNAFLQQFTFLRDSDGAYLASRFASLAPMAQVLIMRSPYVCKIIVLNS